MNCTKWCFMSKNYSTKQQKTWALLNPWTWSLLFDKLSCLLKVFWVLPSVFVLFPSSDQDGLLWIAARWRSSFPESRDRRFIPPTWEKSAAVFCTAQSLPDGAEAVWWSIHGGLLPQLWDRSWGEPQNNTLLQPLPPLMSYYRCYVALMHVGCVSKEEDAAVRWISVLTNVADQLYYPCEHIAWAADAELIKVKSDKWWLLSTVLWGTSLLLGILRSGYTDMKCNLFDD